MIEQRDNPGKLTLATPATGTGKGIGTVSGTQSDGKPAGVSR